MIAKLSKIAKPMVFFVVIVVFALIVMKPVTP